MIEQLKRVVSGHAPLTLQTEPFRECRQCGTSVGEAVSGCPACGSTEIANYEL